MWYSVIFSALTTITGLYLTRKVYLLEYKYNDLRSITRKFLNSKDISLEEFNRYAHMRDLTPNIVNEAQSMGIPHHTIFPWPEHDL